MKKIISLFFIALFSIVSLYAFVDIFGSIYLVLRYEHFDPRSSGFITGKIVFALLCLTAIYFLLKFVRKKTVR